MKNNSTISTLIVLAFIIGIIGILIPVIFFVTKIVYLQDNTFYGNIGDWFGGIAGPLLSFSSFIIVYAALRLQSIESNEQKAESLFQKNLTAIKRFEDSFFYLFAQFNLTIEQLWTIYIKKVERVETNEKGETGKVSDIGKLESKGRRYFSNVLKRLRDTYDNINEESEKQNELNKSQEAYNIVYDIEGANLGLYFKSLQQMLSYIENSELISNKEKPFYINIVRNNISEIEKVILHYHITSIQSDDYSDLISLSAKYELTNNLKERLLLSAKDKFLPIGWNPREVLNL